jgi:DNA-binding NarL/FixJ family response regulator
MELQTEFKPSPSRGTAIAKGNGDVRPDWTQKETRPARPTNPLVEVPPMRPVGPAPTAAPAVTSEPVREPVSTGSTGAVPVARGALTPDPPVRTDEIVQAIKDLVTLLPGKPAAVGLENGLIGIVMCLDPATKKLAVPFLEEQCGYQPYDPTPVEPVGPALNAHILVVEDAYISRLVLRRVIELNPDLMITDVCMPEMDGLQLLFQVRSTPYLAELDVMMCTSTTDRETVLRAAELNVNKYLVKPFQPDQIRDQIREVLTQSMVKSTERVQALKDRLGLNPAACGELFHQLAEQVRDEVKAVRNELGAGKAHAAIMTLQRLRGSCALIRDNELVGRVQTVINAANSNDLFAIVKGLELLEAEGKRLGALSEKLRRSEAPAPNQRHDPLSVAASRTQQLR